MKSTPEKGFEMIDEEIIERVRTIVIKDLEESIRIYTNGGTKEWGGEQVARDLIEKLQNRLPLTFPGGPFWEDGLQHAIVVGEVLDTMIRDIK